MGITKVVKKGWKLSILVFSFLSACVIFNPTKVQAASEVNDYIINNKIQPFKIQFRTGTFNKWIPYENGYGKPEGVVVHETAENLTAEQEVTRFNRDWPTLSAYVHAFVDYDEIINIHSTDAAVWGAGPTANSKYMQVELCREGTYDAFARSLSNDAYYIAQRLIQYGLPDTPNVTVVSHRQMSLKYGETHHGDPDSYFTTWGYSMDQFNDLISLYYNNLKSSGTVYGNNTAAKNVVRVNSDSDIYVPIVSFDNNGTAKTIKNRALADKTSWFTDKTKSYQGQTYYRIATNEWVSGQYKY